MVTSTSPATRKIVFAEIILPLALNQTYTYSVPVGLFNEVSIGKRVIVQFGKRKMYTGLIYSLHDIAPEEDHVKEILSILDDKVLINTTQIKFWEWIAAYYLCSLGEVFKAALPSGLKLESESRFMVREDFNPETLENIPQESIFNLVSQSNGISMDGLVKILKNQGIHKDLNLLLEKKAIVIEESLKDKYKPKKKTFVSLDPSLDSEEKLNQALDSLVNAPRQKEFLLEFLGKLSGDAPDGFINWNARYDKESLFHMAVKIPFSSLKSNHSALSALEKKGFLVRNETETDRFGIYQGIRREIFKLDEQQQTAFDQTLHLFQEKNVVLMHGVTSSGKTEIYIRLIKKNLDEGKQVLYLLPEIALSAQIVARLQEVFGDNMAVYHSKFSDAERVEVYMKIRSRHESGINLVVGVRSAIFLPFDDLGLIIVDEEHENTYKQHDPAPRYHARDSAILLASLYEGKVLLGTATPSVESYKNALDGKYGLVTLNKRFGGMLLPEIKVADVRKARLKKQMKSVFTPLLLKEIETALKGGQQVILFQNRRGYSSYLECEECGWIPYCNKCDVSLTYHRFHNNLNCHYCGYTLAIPRACSACGSTRMVTRGFGTEKIEDEISLLFPGIRIARLDLDSSRSRRSYEKILEDFALGTIDILVGTQMLSKGLDFERVSLVGIISADQMLNFPDFRAFERSFQLMSQVSGRAGRKDKRGKVVIQTTNPEHPVVQYVIHNDFPGLYRDQISERNAFAYPPFVRMIRFIIKGRDYEETKSAAETLAGKQRNIFGKRVLGPQVPLVSRVRLYYLQHILLKIEREASFSKAKGLITEMMKELQVTGELKKVKVNIDVDPS